MHWLAAKGHVIGDYDGVPQPTSGLIEDVSAAKKSRWHWRRNRSWRCYAQFDQRIDAVFVLEDAASDKPFENVGLNVCDWARRHGQRQ